MPKILNYYKIPEKDQIEIEKFASDFFWDNLHEAILWTDSELSKISHLEKSDLHEYDLTVSRIRSASSNKMAAIVAERDRIKEFFNIESRVSEYERKLKDKEKKNN